jgi:hypothetical protein
MKSLPAPLMVLSNTPAKEFKLRATEIHTKLANSKPSRHYQLSLRHLQQPANLFMLRRNSLSLP